MSEMADDTTIDFVFINEILPPEIMGQILEMSDYKSLCSARLTCKHWKLIIDSCNIMEKVKHEYLRSRAYICLSLSSTSSPVISQL